MVVAVVEEVSALHPPVDWAGFDVDDGSNVPPPLKKLPNDMRRCCDKELFVIDCMFTDETFHFDANIT